MSKASARRARKATSQGLDADAIERAMASIPTHLTMAAEANAEAAETVLRAQHDRLSIHPGPLAEILTDHARQLQAAAETGTEAIKVAAYTHTITYLLGVIPGAQHTQEAAA